MGKTAPEGAEEHPVAKALRLAKEAQEVVPSATPSRPAKQQREVPSSGQGRGRGTGRGAAGRGPPAEAPFAGRGGGGAAPFAGRGGGAAPFAGRGGAGGGAGSGAGGGKSRREDSAEVASADEQISRKKVALARGLALAAEAEKKAEKRAADGAADGKKKKLKVASEGETKPEVDEVPAEEIEKRKAAKATSAAFDDIFKAKEVSVDNAAATVAALVQVAPSANVDAGGKTNPADERYKVFVRQITWSKASKLAVREVFSDCGPISELHLPAMMAFVCFKTEEGMRKALRLNGKMWGGRKIKIRREMGTEDRSNPIKAWSTPDEKEKAEKRWRDREEEEQLAWSAKASSTVNKQEQTLKPKRWRERQQQEQVAWSTGDGSEKKNERWRDTEACGKNAGKKGKDKGRGKGKAKTESKRSKEDSAIRERIALIT